MRIAIIGGAGKMGRWLTRFFLEDGHEVIIADRDPEGLRQTGNEFNIPVHSTTAEAVKDADYVLLSVPIESVEDAYGEIGQVVEKMTHNLLR